MKRCIICRKTSVYMRLPWGVRNKKRARPRTRKEQQRRRGQSLNLFDLFEVDGQEQQIQAYLYVSCLNSGLTCHMNQHDLGASLKSPALLVSNRTLQTSSHQQHILCWSNHTCANEQHLPKYSWFCSYLHVTNSDANCSTVAVFFRSKQPLLSPTLYIYVRAQAVKIPRHWFK